MSMAGSSGGRCCRILTTENTEGTEGKVRISYSLGWEGVDILGNGIAYVHFMSDAKTFSDIKRISDIKRGGIGIWAQAVML